MARAPRAPRPLRWIGSARRDYADFPEKLQEEFGYQLHLAQIGLRSPAAKLLKGLGSGTVELVEDFDGDTFRAVYTVRFPSAVYVLHSFKKKSKKGNKTPRADVDLIRQRLKDAETAHSATLEETPSYGHEAD